MKNHEGLHSKNQGCNLFLNNRIKRILSVLAVLAILFVVLFYLQKTQEKNVLYSRNVFAMDTYFTIRAYGPNGEDALKDCEAEIHHLESILSTTREDSDIYLINQDKRKVVAAETFQLISEALDLCEKTNGALDITIFPVLQEWGFTTGSYRVLEREVLNELISYVNFENVDLDKATGEICIEDGMKMDLGAVAKGYTGDRLIEILRKKGVESALLDLGGNVQTLGTKPDGSPWQVAIRNPFDKSETIGVVNINDKCVITSGSYERYFEDEDGQRYWHILDPVTGLPADSGLVSVTIVGDRGVRCDALSTALFVMGREKATNFWREAGDFEMILVDNGGNLYCTEGLVDLFEPDGGRNCHIIKKNEN